MKIMDSTKTWGVPNQVWLTKSTSMNFYRFKFWEIMAIEYSNTSNNNFAQ